MKFESFAKTLTYLPTNEKKIIEKAFHFAEKAHEGQLRKSGKPYFTHVVATAKTLVSMKMDSATIVAGLLHDVPEDTVHTLEEVKELFGEDVAKLVNGVTKLGKVRLRSKKEQQARNLRKMFLAMAQDVRVIIIKLADRLHNMRTISFLPPKKQKGIASETLEIYAPLANRLGIFEIRWQLEDLTLKCLEPKIYKTIKKQIGGTRQERDTRIQQTISLLEKELKKAQIVSRVSGRDKHIYSIYKNVYLKHKDQSIKDLLDQLGIRIIVNDVSDCYHTLGLCHRLFKPIVGRFKDHIAVPKANGYQSLHTGVITKDKDIIEIQIRSEEMHFKAEYGMAAHWKYKDSFDELTENLQERMNWIHQIIDWQKEFQTAFDFVESLKLDLFKDQIFVYTPRSDVIDLPQNATPIDFAYAVHTELGHSAIGAKVNKRMVPLNTKLKSGDIVDILRSSKKNGPSRDWLSFVSTNSAKQKIKSWFKKQEKDENIISGKKILTQELKRIHQISFDDIEEKDLENIANRFNYSNTDGLFEAIGYGAIHVQQVISKVLSLKDFKKDTVDAISFSQQHQFKQSHTTNKIQGVGDLLIKIAPCCEPIPGDKIVGYISRGKGITVHRKNCKNILFETKNEPERIIGLSWEKDITEHYELTVLISARDRRGLLRDILEKISTQNVFISAFDGKSDEKFTGNFSAKISFRLEKYDMIAGVIHSLEEIPDITKIERLDIL